MTQADRKRLEAMEMLILRRMEKISWVDRISNQEVPSKSIYHTTTVLWLFFQGHLGEPMLEESFFWTLWC